MQGAAIRPLERGLPGGSAKMGAALARKRQAQRSAKQRRRATKKEAQSAGGGDSA